MAKSQKDAVPQSLVTGTRNEQEQPEQDVQFGEKNNREYESYDQRLNSYKECRTIPRSKSKELAENGFYQQGDHTLCWRCGLICSLWAADDNVFVRHSSLYPNCPFMKEKRTKLHTKRLNGPEIHLQQPSAARISTNIAKELGHSEEDIEEALSVIRIRGAEETAENLVDTLHILEEFDGPVCRECGSGEVSAIMRSCNHCICHKCGIYCKNNSGVCPFCQRSILAVERIYLH